MLLYFVICAKLFFLFLICQIIFLKQKLPYIALTVIKLQFINPLVYE